MNLWTPQTRHFTNAYATTATPSLEQMMAEVRKARLRWAEAEEKIDPTFRNLRYPIEVIKSPYLADRVQVRFPRSKKKRIRRKWVKDSRNYEMVPWDEVYVVNGHLVMHPVLAKQLTEEMVRRRCQGAESEVT